MAKSNPIDERNNVKNLSLEEQKIYMEKWFRGNYQDPANRCPYDEGEYKYFWGGPYDAFEELEGQFSGEVPHELIQELADELSSENPDWDSAEKFEDYFDFIEPNLEYYASFLQSINQIKEIAKTKLDKNTESFLLKLLYSNIITALETYLSEAFITLVFSHPKYTRNFVEKNKDFVNQKISFSNLYQEYEQVESKIKLYLSNLIWHKLEKIENLYKCTFNIYFSNKRPIFTGIKNRHHLVHRGGKDKKGNKLDITAQELSQLIDNVCVFINDLNTKVNKLPTLNCIE